MVAVLLSKTLVNFYQTTLRHIPEDGNVYTPPDEFSISCVLTHNQESL
jgi:hypothetical protein